jgi:hypothetical protein
MPRPAGVDLHRIFGPNEPPDAWEQRVDYQMFFVHGVANALTQVGLRPNRKLFLPLREEVARERQSWETAVLASTWAGFNSLNQVNRFVEIQNNTFTTAASGMIAIELLLRNNGFKGDIYDDQLCYVVAQDSFITDLNHEVFSELCRRIQQREGGSWHGYVFKRTGQSRELFQELVSGRLVTRQLAEEVFAIIKRFIPEFSGEISNDFHARRESLHALRRGELEADGKEGQSRYKKKITGARAEVYLA